MNFLAHLYLSNSHTNLMLGNFIADHIRGNHFTHFNTEIQLGIKLHREIDTFTDAHPIVRQSKRRLHPRYGLYAGIIIDIFYDHYLAKNWKDYSAIPLAIFVDGVYHLLEENKDILPEKTLHMMPFMIEHNWLYNYQFVDGIKSVLHGMNRRTKGKSQMDLAITDLKELDKDFEKDFKLFFEDLRVFTVQKLGALQLSNTTL